MLDPNNQFVSVQYLKYSNIHTIILLNYSTIYTSELLINMGVDLDCYRARIGTFRCRNNTYSKSSDINSENKCGCTQYVADEIKSFYDILNILFAHQMEAEINIHDIAQDHLMQSNDVEKNPGPVTDSMCCYDHNLTEKCLRKSQCISFMLMTKSKQITEIDTRVW